METYNKEGLLFSRLGGFAILTLSIISHVQSAILQDICLQDENCFLPSCRCNDGRLPGALLEEDIPQMVILSVDDSVTEASYKHYESLLKKLNPNGCSISMTVFISHEYTDYAYVRRLHDQGAEIALQSVTRRTRNSYWKTITLAEMRYEIVQARDMVHAKAGISQEKIRGWRSPFLQPSGDVQFQILKEHGFQYDSSLAVDPSEFTPYTNDVYGMFPFTLDYGWHMPCLVDPCPLKRYGGLWEIPAVAMVDDQNTHSICAYTESCGKNAMDLNELFRFLRYNFQRHYFNGRSPMVLNMRSSWLADDAVRDVLGLFLDMALELKDVYVVNMNQAVEYMKNPQNISAIDSFVPWNYTCSLGSSRNVMAQINSPNITNTADDDNDQAALGEKIDLDQEIEDIILTRRQKILSYYEGDAVILSFKHLTFIIIGGVVGVFVISACAAFMCKSSKNRQVKAYNHRLIQKLMYGFAR